MPDKKINVAQQVSVEDAFDQMERNNAASIS